MRISIVGSSGSGKSTLARSIAAKTGAAHIELDALYHQADWTPRPPEEMVEQVAARMDRAGHWVCDGNYVSVLDGMAQRRADTIVWLDYPRPTIMRQLVARTIRRAVTREQLWNGNREPLTNFTRWEPEKNVIRWSWVHHHQIRDRYELAATDGTWSHATVVRLRGRNETDRWLGEL
jgi:adenylate kinase family enzyme